MKSGKAPVQKLGKQVKDYVVRRCWYGGAEMVNAPVIQYRLDEHGPNREVTMDKPSFSIGSAPTADLVLSRESVDRIHARITRRTEHREECFVLRAEASERFTTEYYVRERDGYVALDPGEEVVLSNQNYFYIGQVRIAVRVARPRPALDSEPLSAYLHREPVGDDGQDEYPERPML